MQRQIRYRFAQKRRRARRHDEIGHEDAPTGEQVPSAVDANRRSVAMERAEWSGIVQRDAGFLPEFERNRAEDNGTNQFGPNVGGFLQLLLPKDVPSALSDKRGTIRLDNTGAVEFFGRVFEFDGDQAEIEADAGRAGETLENGFLINKPTFPTFPPNFNPRRVQNRKRPPEPEGEKHGSRSRRISGALERSSQLLRDSARLLPAEKQEGCVINAV